MDHLPIGEGLQQSLKSPSAPIRRDAIATLVHIYTTSGSSDAQIQTLLDSFAHYDSDDRVREIAGTALGWNPRLIEAIAVLFNASPVPQRLEAVVALRYFLTEGKEVEVLLAHEWLARLAHHDEDEQVREAANQALPKPQQRPSTRFAEPEPGRVRPESGPMAEPTYRRKSWIPWLAGLFSVGLAFGVAAFVLLDRNHLLQPNGSPVRGCGQPIKMISVGGGSVYFQQPGGSSLTARRMLSLDGRSSGVIDRPGIAYSYDLAPDETHIVESRYENVHPNFFIYTWTTSEFAQWNERMLIDGQFPSWSPDMK